MFFENLTTLEKILKNSNTIILALKDGDLIDGKPFNLKKFTSKLKGAEIYEPAGSSTSTAKSFYSVEQMRDIIDSNVTEQTADRYFFFNHAEAFRENAENSILKLIEEPKEHSHYIFITSEPYVLLPTIRSRAEIYQPIVKNPIETAPNVDDKTLALAKRLLVAKTSDIITISEELMKKKDDIRREYAATVIATTIELAYKSYFKTKNEVFIKKIPGLIEAYSNIKDTGCNIKLQLIAALL